MAYPGTGMHPPGKPPRTTLIIGCGGNVVGGALGEARGPRRCFAAWMSLFVGATQCVIAPEWTYLIFILCCPSAPFCSLDHSTSLSRWW